MKLRYLFLSASTILLAACGADDSSKSSPSLISFDLSSYRASNANLLSTTVEGTWVASWSITRDRSDPINASVTPRVESKRLEAFVIRPSDAGHEMSYCGGGFDSISIDEDILTTEHVKTKIVSFSSMESSITTTGRVALGPNASYKETVTLNVEYIKVSNQYESFGSMDQNWSDTDVIIERDVYCSSIDNLEDGYRTVYIASDNEMIFKVSDFIDPSASDAFIKDPDHDGAIVNRLTLGDQNFSFSVNGPEKYIFNYSAENFIGLAVSGQVRLNIPVTE